MSIYLPGSMTRFDPRHVVFSTWMDHMPFGYDLVAQLRPATLVELGTQGGLSYFAFCQSIVENGVDCRAYAVDTWEGEEHTGRYDESVYDMVKSHNDAHYADFSTLLRMYFAEAAEKFGDESIDLLHIDGLHTYEAVREDVETWMPKVRPGGIVVFHDIRARLMDFGVWRLWDELTESHDTFTFQHGFGLGVLRKGGGPAVDSPLLSALFDGDAQQRQAVRDMYVHIGRFLDRRRRPVPAR